MTTEKDPKNCDRCTASLVRGWSERWRDDKRVEVVCFDCDKAERFARYAETDVLTSNLLIDGALYQARREGGAAGGSYARDYLLDRANREIAEIHTACKAFERDVWFGGLQRIVRAASHRGFRASFALDSVQCNLLVWSCAGRTVFTAQPADESYQVSLITAEDEANAVMGIQGICATKGQAVVLIDAATKACVGGANFVRDDKIGMF